MKYHLTSVNGAKRLDVYLISIDAKNKPVKTLDTADLKSNRENFLLQQKRGHIVYKDGTEGNAKISSPTDLAAIEVKAELPSNRFKNYFFAEDLTRRPTPLNDINLDNAGISNSSAPTRIPLLIYINATGIVTEVLPVEVQSIDPNYLAQISILFKNTRFTPGEVNGRQVNSQMRIVLINEGGIN